MLVFVGAGCDIADSGGGCSHPDAIAPVAPLTVAVDVTTVDVHVPTDVAVDATVDVRAAMHGSIDTRMPLSVRAAMDSGVTAPRMVAAPAPCVARCRK